MLVTFGVLMGVVAILACLLVRGGTMGQRDPEL
jgi:hypothetical protein